MRHVTSSVGSTRQCAVLSRANLGSGRRLGYRNLETVQVWICESSHYSKRLPVHFSYATYQKRFEIDALRPLAADRKPAADYQLAVSVNFCNDLDTPNHFRSNLDFKVSTNMTDLHNGHLLPPTEKLKTMCRLLYMYNGSHEFFLDAITRKWPLINKCSPRNT